MSGESQYAVQQAVAAQLLASSAVTALVATRIYDDVPEAIAAYPYIVIGLGSAEDDSTKSEDGLNAVIEIYIWDAKHGGFKMIKQIFAAIYDALHNQNYSVSGQTLVLSQFIASDVRLMDDGTTREGVTRFRIMTSES